MATATFGFVVILPNARRTNVKASRNSTILEILEDVCKKHQLNPNDYDLSRNNKVLDPGNSIGFSGIPNNATLEVVPSTVARVESHVTLGLQLESGKRLMHAFAPKQSLWEVLSYWREQGEVLSPPEAGKELQPVCVFMRQEIVGQEELEKKTLRSLGLTKGSAMIRLVHRTEEQLKAHTQANVSARLSRPEVSGKEEGHGQQQQKQHEGQASNSSKGTKTTDVFGALVSKVKEEKVAKVEPAREEPMDLSSSQTQEQQSPRNVPEKHQQQQVSSSQNQNQAAAASGASASGYQYVPPVVSNAQRFSKRGEMHVVGAHDAVLYHGDDVVIDSQSAGEDDSFFELTIRDVKKMYAQLQVKRQELEETPLQIQSARELQRDTNMLRLMHDYPNTIVRVRFSNRYVLQGVFKTADKLEVVYNWLKSLLRNQNMSFYLFTTPPKKVLDRNSTLVQEDLVGMAVLYFGSEEDSSLDGKVLKPEIYAAVSAPDAVFAAVRQKLARRGGGGGEENEGEASMETDQDKVQQASSSGSGPSDTGSGSSRPQPKPQKDTKPVLTSENVPKWFKMGKK